jgi:hypothetical protein
MFLGMYRLPLSATLKREREPCDDQPLSETTRARARDIAGVMYKVSTKDMYNGLSPKAKSVLPLAKAVPENRRSRYGIERRSDRI